MTLRPPRLDPAGRSAWRSAVATLEAIGEQPELSRGALESYAKAVSLAAALRREWVADGGQGIHLGPRGSVSVHPLLRAIERAERQAHELGASLGLDPMSRHRLGRGVRGRPQGATSAADRQKVVSMPQRRTLRSG